MNKNFQVALVSSINDNTYHGKGFGNEFYVVVSLVNVETPDEQGWSRTLELIGHGEGSKYLKVFFGGDNEDVVVVFYARDDDQLLRFVFFDLTGNIISSYTANMNKLKNVKTIALTGTKDDNRLLLVCIY